jgi:hypothetical protein
VRICRYENEKNMGMSYIMVLEDDHVKEACEGYFPSSLSYFVERVGKYDEKSEFSQIEKMLDIELDLFNHLKQEHYENNWLTIEFMLHKINLWIQKIDRHPNFFQQIIYDSKFSSEKERKEKLYENMKIIDGFRLQLSAGNISEQEFLRRYEEISISTSFPAKIGYLENGKLKEDLETLKDLLKCYQKNGAEKINLLYM